MGTGHKKNKKKTGRGPHDTLTPCIRQVSEVGMRKLGNQNLLKLIHTNMEKEKECRDEWRKEQSVQ